MVQYVCPKCRRVVELPEGAYYCKVCGPRFKLEPIPEFTDEVIDFPDLESCLKEGYVPCHATPLFLVRLNFR